MFDYFVIGDFVIFMIYIMIWEFRGDVAQERESSCYLEVPAVCSSLLTKKSRVVVSWEVDMSN